MTEHVHLFLWFFVFNLISLEIFISFFSYLINFLLWHCFLNYWKTIFIVKHIIFDLWFVFFHTDFLQLFWVFAVELFYSWQPWILLTNYDCILLSYKINNFITDLKFIRWRIKNCFLASCSWSISFNTRFTWFSTFVNKSVKSTFILRLISLHKLLGIFFFNFTLFSLSICFLINICWSFLWRFLLFIYGILLFFFNEICKFIISLRYHISIFVKFLYFSICNVLWDVMITKFKIMNFSLNAINWIWIPIDFSNKKPFFFIISLTFERNDFRNNLPIVHLVFSIKPTIINVHCYKTLIAFVFENVKYNWLFTHLIFQSISLTLFE